MNKIDFWNIRNFTIIANKHDSLVEAKNRFVMILMDS